MAQLPEPSEQMIRILLVDDEVRLTELLRLELDVEGMTLRSHRTALLD